MRTVQSISIVKDKEDTMSIDVKKLEEIYLRILSNADITNPNVLEIVNDLRQRIKKAESVRPTDQLTGVLISGAYSAETIKNIPFPSSRPVAPTRTEETTPGMTKDSWVQGPEQQELFDNNLPEQPKSKRGGPGTNKYTGPKYTKFIVQAALDKHYSPWDAGLSIGMKDPNYIYQLIKKYGIKRKFKSL